MSRKPHRSHQHLFCIETTPPGRGGIGVVEIVGKCGWEAIAGLIAGRAFRNRPRLALVDLADGDDHIDEALLAFVPPDRSLWGLESVEVNLHGGPVCVKRLTRALKCRGIPLKTSRHLYETVARSGRFDAVQLDAMRLLPSAPTLRAAAMLAAQQRGALSEVILEIAASLRSFRAGTRPAGLREAVGRLDGLIRAASYGIALTAPQLCVIAGEPNAGKSLLFNALLARQRAIVHPEAGTTRDFVEAVTSCNGVPFRLVDTAGIPSKDAAVRAEEGEIEAAAQRQSRLLLNKAKVVLWVVDAHALCRARSGSQVDNARIAAVSPAPSANARTRRRMARRQSPNAASVVVVLNKADMLSSGELQAAAALPLELPEPLQHGPIVQVATSALTGDGIEALRHRVVGCVAGIAAMPESAAPQVFTRGQLKCLLRARHAAAKAESPSSARKSPASRNALTAAVELLLRLVGKRHGVSGRVRKCVSTPNGLSR